MQTFPDHHTRRLLGELTNCGRNAANPTGLMKRTGISRSMSYAISPNAPGGVENKPNRPFLKESIGALL
jgi:hypothetical protein